MKRPRRRQSISELRRLARGLIVLLLVAVPATAAMAKSFWMSNPDVDIVIQDDGALFVTETLTYDFDGDFAGAYRDIPLRPGEEITDVSVRDETTTYELGGCTELGCSSPPGSYGVEVQSDLVRIVWHHSSFSEQRTFQITYTMTGLAIAYDDVVDVNFQVWGDQWAVGLDRLDARMTLPAAATVEQADVRVYGHPYSVDGSTTLGAGQTFLEANNVPAYQWVELRTVFPRELLASTDMATVVAGNGLDGIIAEEDEFAREASDAATAQRTGIIWGSILALAFSVGLGGLVYLGYGREPKVDYDREYEQEPPTDLKPAEVGALLSQGAVTEHEFTATMFDLIRQGAIKATPSQVERSTWGGLRNETITDLVLELTDQSTGYTDYEQSVLTVVGRVLDEGPRPLHEFREQIQEDASANATTYQTFRGRVLGAVPVRPPADDARDVHGVADAHGRGEPELLVLGLEALGHDVLTIGHASPPPMSPGT